MDVLGAAQVPMAKQRLAIEPLYEDIPNTTFDASQRVTNRVSKALHNTEHKMLSSKFGSAKKSTSLPSSNQNSASGSVTAYKETLNSRKVGSTSATPSARRKPSSSASQASGSSPLDDHDNKMGNSTALDLYGHKMTPHEKNEIIAYPNVYFLGLDAKKKNKEPGDKSTTAFDDDEHFYQVVPYDHIAYRYEVAEKPNLGKGTFGQVIKAYDHKERKWIALKMVRNEKIYLNQSKEELRILQTLRKHDLHGLFNVVKLFDYFIFRNHMVLSFELLGMNLYQVLKRNNYHGLPASKILPIAKGVLKCLELLCRNRIVHCDIKPENIMLRKNGDLTSIKVGDFGSSCYEQQQKYHYIQSRYYRAPEVLLGMRYGPAIDMWSFGCVLGELVTGSPIFVGEDEDDQLASIAEAIGEIPNSLLNKSKSSKRGASRRNGRGGPGSSPLQEILEGDVHFKDAVKKILEWDPDSRPTPEEMQQHRWLSSSRPRRTTIDSGKRHGSTVSKSSSKSSTKASSKTSTVSTSGKQKA